MIRKRIIGVITVRRGIAVQSFGYGRYLPMGSAEVVAGNLDRWGADEIALLSIDRSLADAGPDIALLERVARRGLSTPLVYGGGIRGSDDARRVIGAGADRVICDAILHDDPYAALHVGDAIGTQAVIANLPLSITDGSIGWYDYRRKTSQPLTDELREVMGSRAFSELMITDWRHEGQPKGFDPRLIEAVGVDTPLILFGGISDPVIGAPLLANSHVVAVAVGNFLAYREHAIQKFREGLEGGGVDPSVTRPAVYRGEEKTVHVG